MRLSKDPSLLALLGCYRWLRCNPAGFTEPIKCHSCQWFKILQRLAGAIWGLVQGFACVPLGSVRCSGARFAFKRESTALQCQQNGRERGCVHAARNICVLWTLGCLHFEEPSFAFQRHLRK